VIENRDASEESSLIR